MQKNNRIFTRFLQTLVSLLGACMMQTSFADLISSFEATAKAGAEPNAATLTYDAASDMFTANSDLGTVTSPGVLLGQPFNFTNILADDIIGTFSLSAMIDEFGTLSGGSFSWIGTTDSLGITTAVTLVSGVLLQFQDSSATSGNFQFLANVTSVNPQMTAVTGPILSALVNFIGPPPGGNPDVPWSISATGLTPGAAPDLYFSRKKVPEPGTLALLCIGIAGMGMARRRKI